MSVRHPRLTHCVCSAIQIQSRVECRNVLCGTKYKAGWNAGTCSAVQNTKHGGMQERILRYKIQSRVECRNMLCDTKYKARWNAGTYSAVQNTKQGGMQERALPYKIQSRVECNVEQERAIPSQRCF